MRFSESLSYIVILIIDRIQFPNHDLFIILSYNIIKTQIYSILLYVSEFDHCLKLPEFIYLNFDNYILLIQFK